ncbi:hypothetical protein ADUPG1_008231 [Aduncisulcus paluster]|uniref:Uncharacterized protein n=1 Tax=Aduncisulcus paluster TaxID=2918883 RepID=A0ABQ5KVB9_9EUKA|nr:hypothetical protein ADUPG1_008231 [Aduncisulcus paluster]
MHFSQISSLYTFTGAHNPYDIDKPWKCLPKTPTQYKIRKPFEFSKVTSSISSLSLSLPQPIPRDNPPRPHPPILDLRDCPSTERTHTYVKDHEHEQYITENNNHKDVDFTILPFKIIESKGICVDPPKKPKKQFIVPPIRCRFKPDVFTGEEIAKQFGIE